jgi:hypothetical protein
MGIENFVSNFQGGARPNRFRVILTWPAAVGTPNVRDEIVIQAAGLPASTIGIVQVPYMGRTIPIPGDPTFEDWNITVVNDRSFSHRNAFERWHELMIGRETNVQTPASFKDLLVNADVFQLDRDDKILKSYKFYHMFPTLVSQIDVDYNNNDQLELFNVTFSFAYWKPSV